MLEVSTDGRRGGEEGFSLVRRAAPAGFRVQLVVLDPASERPYRSADWRGALVVVERGAIVLATRCGDDRRLACGAVLWLERLPLRAIANPHPEPALLSVLTRQEG